MKNIYLNYKGYYIKDDLKSLLLYYDFFSQGLSLPKQISHSFIQKSLHRTLRLLIIILYITKIYLLVYKRVNLEDDAIIIIQGKGTWGSTIKLVEKNNEYKILKKVRNKKLFLKEKMFYDTYKNTGTKIRLPECKFLSKNIIEMNFLKLKSFQRRTIDGTFNFKKSVMYYKDIRNELEKFYKNKRTLIHGDLFLPNIYIDNNEYYLIDFTESHNETFQYDLYVLLFSILCSYGIIKLNEKTIKNSTVNGESTLNLLKININDLLSVEKKFIDYREKRFPGVYYS
ncbi:MAG TPA: RIO1 family regulatory kinase/ATPase [Patescibacteria group bacterium]